MLCVERGLRARKVDRPFRARVPGYRDEPVEIRTRHGVLGGGHRHLRQAVQLAQRFLLHCLRHAGGLDPVAQLLDLLRLVVGLAQFLLDRLELLPQEILALVLPHLRLHLRLDLRTELEHLRFLDEKPVEVSHPRADVERLEHFLPGGGGHGGQARRDEVGQLARFGDVARQRLQLVGEQRGKGHDSLEVVLDVPLEGVDLEAVFLRRHVLGRVHRRTQERIGRRDAIEHHARKSLHDQPQAAVRQLEHLVDVRDRADRVEILLPRVVDGRLPLGEDAYELAVRDGRLDKAHGAFPRDGQRHERAREQDRVAQGQYRQLGGHGRRPVP